MNCIIRNILILAGLMILSACAGQVTSEVTCFHQNTIPMGGTIAVVALDETKQHSLEFATYAGKMAEILTEIGYKVVDAGAGPELLAKMDYSVGDGQTNISTWPNSFVHYRFNYGYFYPYYLGYYWDEPEIYTYTIYPRALDLIIVNADGVSQFEGHVKSLGQEQNINEVMPYLIEAIFQNFPGESGVTKVVTIQKDGTKQLY